MSDTGKKPILVLISGNGSNLQALIDATQRTTDDGGEDEDDDEDKPSLPHARIVRVISNRKNAFGLTRAKQADIPTTYHNLGPYKQKQADTEAGVAAARQCYDQDLARLIVDNDPKPALVVCAGWMHILSSSFIDALEDAGVAIINLHPALPGKFDGANAIQRAWAAFQRGEIVSTGVMIHHVVGEVDAGPPIVIEEVECTPEEPEQGLAARIHEVEWRLIVKGTAMALEEIDQGKKV